MVDAGVRRPRWRWPPAVRTRGPACGPLSRYVGWPNGWRHCRSTTPAGRAGPGRTSPRRSRSASRQCTRNTPVRCRPEPPRRTEMFERFTEPARAVVMRAQQEARQLHQPYVGTEHLLLALLSAEAGIARTVLTEAVLTARQVRAVIPASVSTVRAMPA